MTENTTDAAVEPAQAASSTEVIAKSEAAKKRKSASRLATMLYVSGKLKESVDVARAELATELHKQAVAFDRSVDRDQFDTVKAFETARSEAASIATPYGRISYSSGGALEPSVKDPDKRVEFLKKIAPDAVSTQKRIRADKLDELIQLLESKGRTDFIEEVEEVDEELAKAAEGKLELVFVSPDGKVFDDVLDWAEGSSVYLAEEWNDGVAAVKAGAEENPATPIAHLFLKKPKAFSATWSATTEKKVAVKFADEFFEKNQVALFDAFQRALLGTAHELLIVEPDSIES